MVTGPGTFWCRYANCSVTGPCLPGQASVRWGPLPHQIIHQQKRYTCRMGDIVYQVHCQACLSAPVPAYTNYIGETDMVNFYYISKENQHLTIILLRF